LVKYINSLLSDLHTSFPFCQKIQVIYPGNEWVMQQYMMNQTATYDVKNI